MQRSRMFSETVLALLASLSLVVLAADAYGADAPYKFTVTDVPLHFTFLGQEREDIVRLSDIDNKGQLVGNNFAGDGFLVDKRQRTTEIRCPGDVSDNTSTTVSAINNAGQLVGSCSDGERVNGFVRNKKGKIVLINYPDSDGTVVLGINDLGQVVGQYWGFAFGEGLQRFHGFVFDDGVYTTLDAPFDEAMFTTLSAINNAGQIIGTYLHHRPGSSDINDYDSEVAFLYENGNFSLLEFPDTRPRFLCCGAATFPMDINNLGQVIGATYDGEGNRQFFLFDGEEYFTITGLPENVTDSASSWGINDKSEIAGTYVQQIPCDFCGIEGEPGFRFEVHAFVAKPKKVRNKHPLLN